MQVQDEEQSLIRQVFAKLAQLIVQARIPYSNEAERRKNADFNIQVTDLVEVSDLMKSIIGEWRSGSPKQLTVFLVAVKNPSGNDPYTGKPAISYLLPISKPSHEMVLLEKWHFEVCKQHQVMREADTAIVAKQLCLMLRSLMSLMRVLPAASIVRRNRGRGADPTTNCTVHFQLSDQGKDVLPWKLGEAGGGAPVEYKSRAFKEITSSLGNLCLSVEYAWDLPRVLETLKASTDELPLAQPYGLGPMLISDYVQVSPAPHTSPPAPLPPAAAAHGAGAAAKGTPTPRSGSSPKEDSPLKSSDPQSIPTRRPSGFSNQPSSLGTHGSGIFPFGSTPGSTAGTPPLSLNSCTPPIPTTMMQRLSFGSHSQLGIGTSERVRLGASASPSSLMLLSSPPMHDREKWLLKLREMMLPSSAPAHIDEDLLLPLPFSDMHCNDDEDQLELPFADERTDAESVLGNFVRHCQSVQKLSTFDGANADGASLEEWLMRLEQLRLVGQQRSGTSRSAITSAVGSTALAMPRAARPGSLLGN